MEIKYNLIDSTYSLDESVKQKNIGKFCLKFFITKMIVA
jgi:hypothetical protein